MGTCPETVLLELLAHGELSDDDALSLRAHLEACPECRARYDRCREDGQLLDELRDLKILPGDDHLHVAEAIDSLDAGQPLDKGVARSRPVRLSPRTPSTANGPPPHDATDRTIPLNSPSADRDATVQLSGPSAKQPRPTEGIHLPGYEIHRKIGQGGQGAVYEATQLRVGRRVAVKILADTSLAKDSARKRFEREVELAARLDHPNLVTIHDSGAYGGYLYYAMAFVDGRPLDAYVRSGQLGLRDRVRLFAKICDAIGYAHLNRVIHRDLKPSNVLVDPQGEPRIVDFGLAKDLTMVDATQVSLQGQIMGTLAYMSPEQTLGTPERIDLRSDVYSLGVMLYELLTGKLPYDTNANIIGLRQVLQNIQEVDPPRPSQHQRNIGGDLDAIVGWAMQKDPDRRYRSGSAMADDLRCWLEGRPVTARSDSALYLLTRMATRHYFHTSAIGTILLTIIGFSIALYSIAQHENARADRLAALNQEFARNQTRLEQAVLQARITYPQQVFAWFLREWENDRLEVARSLQSLIAKGSPEYAATAVLLDADLRNDLLTDLTDRIADPCLASLVEGEWHLKHQHLDEARRAFGQYAAGCEGFWHQLIIRRVRELGHVSSTDSAGGVRQ